MLFVSSLLTLFDQSLWQPSEVGALYYPFHRRGGNWDATRLISLTKGPPRGRGRGRPEWPRRLNSRPECSAPSTWHFGNLFPQQVTPTPRGALGSLTKPIQHTLAFGWQSGGSLGFYRNLIESLLPHCVSKLVISSPYDEGSRTSGGRRGDWDARCESA